MVLVKRIQMEDNAFQHTRQNGDAQYLFYLITCSELWINKQLYIRTGISTRIFLIRNEFSALCIFIFLTLFLLSHLSASAACCQSFVWAYKILAHLLVNILQFASCIVLCSHLSWQPFVEHLLGVTSCWSDGLYKRKYGGEDTHERYRCLDGCCSIWNEYHIFK